MLIVDTALEDRARAGNPIRVAMVGSGFMARGIAQQLVGHVDGMDLVAIASRDAADAERAWASAGVTETVAVSSRSQVEQAATRGAAAVTDDPLLLCEAPGVDAILEVTGSIEAGAQVAVAAIRGGKHTVLMNAELNATLGPILKVHADREGVIVSDADGDEPGVAMGLILLVRSMGYQPVLAGNIKGFYDPYRNPDTQQGFAEATGQRPRMVTSFADGTKLSMECTILANAADFRVYQRGMVGHRCEHVREIANAFPLDELLEDGVVDFTLGAEPGSGAFVVAYGEPAERDSYMAYFKMGDGPLYTFYRPFHLPHLEVPLTVARAVLFGDAAVTPVGAPRCDVLTVAKRDLRAGEELDGIGGYMTYGLIENARVSLADELLPMGLSEGCRLKIDVDKDAAVGYADVELPSGRFADELRAEQVDVFGSVRPAS